MNEEQISNLISTFRARLQQALPGEEAHSKMFPAIKAGPRIAPENAIVSAVMILLFLKNKEWHIIAIKRTEDGKAHSGQISFPGGRYEDADENFEVTALRETFEEVGILPDDIEVVGSLSPLYIIVSNYKVFPFVGFLKKDPEYNISPQEVSKVMEIPLSELFAENTRTITEVTSPAIPGIVRQVNAYRLSDGTIIWGATAMIIAEFEMLFTLNNI